MKHLLKHLIWYSGNICTCQSTLCNVYRMTNAGSNDLSLDICNCKDLCDLADQVKTICRNIVQSAKERRYIGCTCSCSKKCLICSEDQSNICLDSFFGQNFNSLQSFSCHRDLNNHVRMNLSDLTTLTDHTFCICCGSLNLTADRSVNDLCNLFDNFIKVSALFCDQRRVCGNTTDDPHIICCFNILYLCCVNKKLHCIFLLFLKLKLTSLALFRPFFFFDTRNCLIPHSH